MARRKGRYTDTSREAYASMLDGADGDGEDGGITVQCALVMHVLNTVPKPLTAEGIADYTAGVLDKVQVGKCTSKLERSLDVIIVGKDVIRSGRRAQTYISTHR